jgi:hypothetical protein
MTNNPQYAVFRKWTGGPGLLAGGSKPGVGSVVLNVRGIDQRNENVNIKQKPSHGSSSRS